MFVIFSVAVQHALFPRELCIGCEELARQCNARDFSRDTKMHTSKQIYQIYTVCGREKKWATVLNLTDSRSFNSFSSVVFFFFIPFELQAVCCYCGQEWCRPRRGMGKTGGFVLCIAAKNTRGTCLFLKSCTFQPPINTRNGRMDISKMSKFLHPEANTR